MSSSSSLREASSNGNVDTISTTLQDESSINHQFSGSGISTPPIPNNVDQEPAPAPTPTKPSILKRAWTKLGINGFVVMFMVKPSLAVTISAGIYQRRSVAANYLNFGYLIMIISVLTVPMLPRGKFLMNLFLSMFLTCFGAGMVLLGQWCGIKARQNTTSADAPAMIAHGYNSSAATINAIFLVVNIFGISVLRAARPAFSIPSVIYTVFVLVGFVYGPQQYSEHRSQIFVRELFYTFLTGQGISAGVSLFIIPISSRKVFFGETTGFLQTCRGLLKAQQAFIETLEHSGGCDPSRKPQSSSEEKLIGPADVGTDQKRVLYENRASMLKSTAAGLLTLGSKLREDVVFAKREIAYGHLGSSDIHQLHLLLRNIMIPISGLSTLADISERLILPREKGTSTEMSNPLDTVKMTDGERTGWHELIVALNPSFRHIIQVLDESILHILVLFKLVPRPPTTPEHAAKNSLGEDVEKGLQRPQPGGPGFGNYLDQQIKDFRQLRTAKLRLWAEERGLSAVFHTSAEYWSSEHPGGSEAPNLSHLRISQRLHIVLYMEYLLYSVSKAVLTMVRFAESKVDDGTMSKQYFIFPTFKTLRRWAKGLINGEDSGPDVDRLDHMAGNVESVYLGDSFQSPKDPEHLPPKNVPQVLGNYLRRIPKLLSSDSAKFGARVTIGVMSVGIMAFLKDSRPFFIRQRVVWGVVMVAIGMSPTSGSSVFNLIGNLTATLFGMIGSFINWYIVDQRTAGVIVFLFIFMTIYFYFAARNPRFLVAIVAGAVTHILIIGNELQVRVLGTAQYTATGQPYYPVYELAPYRLLVVGGGCLVAYIWTIFPVPITEGSVLRRDLGGSLFLLAKYVSSVTSSVDQRLLEKEGDISLSLSLSRQLEKMRLSVLAKEVVLLNSMRQNLAFMAWEPRLGGDFPKKTYESIIKEVQNAVNYLTIIAYASEAFSAARLESSTSTWLSEFSRSRYQTDHKSHKIISLFTLLSASIRNSQPLPPYTKAPTHFALANATVGDDTHLLGLHNIDEPGFRAVAVIEVAHECLIDSMDVIVGLVKDLVGELDFSYSIMNTTGTSGGSMDSGSVEGKQKSF